MKLYHCRDARSFRCLWVLEELGLECDVEHLPFPPRFQQSDYLEINPLGTIPALVDGQVVLTESSAILQYLADKFSSDLKVTPDEKAYGEYLNWMYRSDATFTFPLAIVLRYGRFEALERQLPQAEADYIQFFLSRIKSVEAVLSDGRQFLCANRFTMADIAVHYGLYLGELIGLAHKYKPFTLDYLARLKEIPSFQRSLDKQVHMPPFIEG